MSQNHFTAIVIGENHNEIMAKYSNKLKVSPYIVMKFSDADLYRNKYIKFYKALLSKANSDIISKTDEYMQPSIELAIKELENQTNEEFFESVALQYGYDTDPETGDLYTTSNPNGNYDHCNIGKFFSLPLITKNGEEVYSAKKKDINWKEIHLNNTKPYEIAWDTVVEGVEPNGEYEKRIYENMKNKKEYFLKYGTRENYIMSSTSFWGYAYVDKDKWAELEDNVDQFKWVMDFYNRFIEPLDDNETITIYECIRN